jgi:HEPN domain-containing protein
VRIDTRCNSDALAASGEGGRKGADAALYLQALAQGHIEVVNSVIQRYRLATYDLFPYEIAPWDVPIWFAEAMGNFVRVQLFDYAGWEHKPVISEAEGSQATHQLLPCNDLRVARMDPGPGELELLDAANLMERGDYSGAVRRAATAIEAATEAALAGELGQRSSKTDVDEALRKSKDDFPGRLRQYEKLAKRSLPPELRAELERTRELRHAIVHRGHRVGFRNRGEAQRSVDTGRWIFNWLENRPERQQIRERHIVKRLLGRHFALFDAEIGPEGIEVTTP